jgi:hypothetical protein
MNYIYRGEMEGS